MTSKHRLAALLFLFAVGGQVVLWWYLVVLAGRTDWFAHGTSIGLDTIAGFYLVGIASSVALVAAAHLAGTRRVLFSGLALCGTSVLAFLVLNLTGVVWEYQKEGPESLWQVLKSVL
jgi:nitrate reductase gamma subunit